MPEYSIFNDRRSLIIPSLQEPFALCSVRPVQKFTSARRYR